MQVILNEDYPGLGFVGDLVNVKPGFARNFLLPRAIALPASAASISMLEHRKRVLEVKKAEHKKDAETLKTKISGTVLKVEHSTAIDNKLFGSISLSEIHAKLAEAGIQVDRKLIRLEAPIRTLGEHIIEIKLHQDVTAEIKLVVEKKGGEKEPVAQAEAQPDKTNPAKEAKKSAPKKPRKEKGVEAKSDSDAPETSKTADQTTEVAEKSS